MGFGVSTGEKRAEEAARAAINSPLLEVSITGARGVLFAVAGGDDLGMLEIQDAARVVTESIDPHAKVIFGTIRDDKLKKNEVKVTVIATGFPEPDGMPHSSSQTLTSFERPERVEERAESRGRIFNTIGMMRSSDESKEEAPVVVREDLKTVTPKEPKPVDPVDEEESDEDWGAVPAFLRRSKLK
jgi:cell division protein FtsZ